MSRKDASGLSRHLPRTKTAELGVPGKYIIFYDFMMSLIAL